MHTLLHRLHRLHNGLLITAIFVSLAISTPAHNVEARGGKQVYAYYFGWHTGVSWQDGRLIDQPLARYDSREQWAIERHVTLAQGAGIDAFIMSWFGRKDNNITYPAFETLLKVAAAKGFHAAASVDMSQDNFNTTVDELTDSLNYLIKEKVNQPGYLRFDGKPVIYFWNQSRFTAAQWRDIRKAIDPKHTTIWVMEGTDTSLLAFFDGLYLFNTAWSNNPAGTASGWAGRTYGSGGHFFTPTVMPGWDESRIAGRGNPTAPQDRAGGAFLANSWDGAVQSGSRTILIVSWNEFLENSYIEPSEKYGTTALDVLRTRIAAWKAGRSLPPFKAAAASNSAAAGQNAANPSNPAAPQAPAAPAANVASAEWQGKSLTSAVGKLTVRAAPGVGQRRIGVIDTGQVYPILDKVNGWFKFDYNGKIGYVSGDFVTVQ